MALKRSDKRDADKEDNVPRHDEEDEEEEEEDDEDTRPTKRKYNPFIDEMAIVDDDEDDDDEDEEYGREDGFIEEENEEVTSTKTTARRHLDLDRRRREMEGMDDEQVAAFYAEKYGGRSKPQSFKDTEEVPQQLLLPSVNDPNLWMVKCKPGKEKDVIFGLMKRCFDRQETVNSLDTFSAFARETLKGYIYVEARRQAHVQEALANIPNVYMSTLMLVPIKDMVDSISVQKKEVEIPLGGWVRIKRGTYAGDLAQVMEVSDSQDQARVKVVPRLDLDTANDEELNNGLNKKRKKGVRAPPKLFNPERLANRSISSLQKKGPYWVYNGDHYRDGYLEKYMKVTTLQIEEVNPTLDEIARFAGSGELNGEDGERSIDLTSLSSMALNNAQAQTMFQNGDVVSVIEGDMIHSWGTVENVHDSSVVVSLDMDGIKKRVTLPAKQLRKKFKAGDHVKVINGRFKDESGMVLNIEDNIVTLLSDASLKEVRVFAKDLREAAEVMFGKTVIGNYELHDLVQLDFYTVGVIVKVDRDSFKILTQNGEMRTVEPHQITNKRDSNKAVATDANGNSIRSGDTVLEVGDKRNCSVLHLYRNLVFLHSREHADNFGVWVTNTRSIVSAATRGRIIPNPERQNPQFGNSPANGGFGRDNGRGGDRGGRGGPPTRGGFYGRGRGGRDNLIAKTVRISQGPHKGYIGIVKDATDTQARVELHTSSKVISVEKNHLMILDAQGNSIGQAAPDRFDSPSNNNGGFARPMATPSRYGDGAMTPMHGAASGSRTPAWNSGSKTPAWNSGARTPNPYNDGGRTPAWDSGSKTPMWGHETPAWNSSSSNNNNSSSSNNHHHSHHESSSSSSRESRSSQSHHPRSSSSQAPKPSSSYSSSSNRFADPDTAPTPGASWAAPTPAASYEARAPTPAVNFSQTPYDAPTPYEAAPTPGAGLIPPTPAAMMSAPTPGSYLPTTPGNFMPTTPATGLPQTPFMPTGGDYGHIEDQGDQGEDNWPIEEIEVKLKRSQGDAQQGQIGRIVTVNRNSRKCLVDLEDGQQNVDMSFEYLEPVRPSKKDNVRIILGEHRGELGSLVGVDSHDGIVRLRGDGTGYKILSMSSVAKYVGTDNVD
ncbi:hypothetical protein HPULCUR_006427 [Helicostylum pulchrum]|uniref:Transcription elongation factor SPT5 n=1 Tax=Helicostylum pulchrum TaxID=562976 RepID=A0ABP9Y1V0_9FUNG